MPHFKVQLLQISLNNCTFFFFVCWLVGYLKSIGNHAFVKRAMVMWVIRCLQHVYTFFLFALMEDMELPIDLVDCV